MRNDEWQQTQMFQCPKCCKHSLVQMGVDKFRCIWCGFKSDLSEPDFELSSLIMLILLVGVLLLLLL